MKFVLEVCVSVNLTLCQVNTAQSNTLMHSIVTNKFGAKMFRHFWDIAISCWDIIFCLTVYNLCSECNKIKCRWSLARDRIPERGEVPLRGDHRTSPATTPNDYNGSQSHSSCEFTLIINTVIWLTYCSLDAHLPRAGTGEPTNSVIQYRTHRPHLVHNVPLPW